ncbi:unnamed protein product [Caenorhabditis auriculariae]|uniref:Protein male abnormal 21 n=1 Tax=Caenorhabditis auriculariae TaxID=2777116 RepID=A0A8S1GXP4_9PELO|nr:unnamed protein product [Caenorhabditis auriculariae]
MLGHNPNTVYEVNNYYNEKVQLRKNRVSKVVYRVVKVVQDVLKEVEAQEPRFISTTIENAGRFEGFVVHSPHEFEIIMYLNQMGVFNFVDDGSIQGCAVLKLSDGRKRSMSLWVEFITASGYLSARKIRNRFQSIVAQVVEKAPFRDYCTMINDNSDVRLRVDDKYTVQITTAFRCNGIWPRSASHWPLAGPPWPPAELAGQVKTEGFDLTSRETAITQPNSNKQANTMEADAWAMNLASAENVLLIGGRRKTLSILKCLRDTHLDFAGTPVTNYILKTLVLYECEKHCADYEWDDNAIGDRMIGILLQLVSCLQCRRCAHYFLPSLDLLRSKPPHAIEHSAQLTWALVRKLMLDPLALQSL